MSMPLRVLIAPDKFKGSLTASQAAQAIARGWRSIRKRDGLTLLPITDGGDGFGDTYAAVTAGAETDGIHGGCGASSGAGAMVVAGPVPLGGWVSIHWPRITEQCLQGGG